MQLVTRASRYAQPRRRIVRRGLGDGNCPDGYTDDGSGNCVAEASAQCPYGTTSDGNGNCVPNAAPPPPPPPPPSPPPPAPGPGPAPAPPAPAPNNTTVTTGSTGMSTGEVVGIVVAGVAAVGLIGYAVWEQKKGVGVKTRAKRAVTRVRRGYHAARLPA